MGEEIEAGLRWLIAMDSSQSIYKYISDYLFNRKYASVPDTTARRKMSREAARSVLPNAAETKVFVTVNGRAARHFIEMRASEAADAEMRRLAVEFCRVLVKASPNLFGDYRVKLNSDGHEWLDTDHRKV
jgi:thymidylate synthase (FAD)